MTNTAIDKDHPVAHTNAERRIGLIVEAGGYMEMDVDPNYLRELADRIESTHARVEAAGTIPELIIEEECLMTIPFAKLADFLASKGIDLEALRDNHIQMLVRRGIIKDSEAEAYKAKFNVIHVDGNELKDIKKGSRPMLFVDNMTPNQASTAFIEDLSNISFELGNFSKVDPNTGEYLEDQAPSNLTRFTFVSEKENIKEPLQLFLMLIEDLERAMQELHLGNGKSWKDMSKKEKQEIINNRAIDTRLYDSGAPVVFLGYRNLYFPNKALLLGWDTEKRRMRRNLHDVPNYWSSSKSPMV